MKLQVFFTILETNQEFFHTPEKIYAVKWKGVRLMYSDKQTVPNIVIEIDTETLSF